MMTLRFAGATQQPSLPAAPAVTRTGYPSKQRDTRNRVRFLALFLLICALGWQPDRALSQSTRPAPAKVRDGAHDFDFSTGVWHTHIRLALDPFSPSSEVIELNGTVTTRLIWGGRARLEEIEADGPKGHWEGLSLFLYNPQSHQWSQTFINSKAGVLSGSLVGEFHGGRGELYQHDTYHDKSIFVRALWSEIAPNPHRYTESFSNDGGKTWVTSFDAHKTREKDLPTSDMAAGAEPMSADPEEHAFDFALGTWKTQSSRLMRPLTGSATWSDQEGQAVVQRVWGGRANLAEFVADGPAGRVQALALRWFNRNTHEWNVEFATPVVGTLSEQPEVGQCKDGRCEFFDQEPFDGRMILVRHTYSDITPTSFRTEQSYSVDGGATWEVNWITKYKRAN
jgi:hypothetical protein